jgi:hypothetical protein
MIPNHPELTEVDLSVLKLSFVMPPMDFGYSEQVPKPSESVIQIRVLEGQMHRD